jgi:NAD(P)-dependent dehydrogenase (short-subunit alcohol dehydrogenase family)
MKKLEGKVAVVTGASKGIGAGIAKAFAAEGASVVVNYASSKTGADKVVAEIKAGGGKAIVAGGDVSKAKEAQGIIDAAIQKDINELRDQMSGVRKEIDELRGRINRDSYTAKKTTDGAGATVVLVNEHPMMMMETLVNAATHRVMPGMSLSVPVAPGPVNIQVLQTDPFVRARMLMPGETKIVTMR